MQTHLHWLLKRDHIVTAYDSLFGALHLKNDGSIVAVLLFWNITQNL